MSLPYAKWWLIVLLYIWMSGNPNANSEQVGLSGMNVKIWCCSGCYQKVQSYKSIWTLNGLHHSSSHHDVLPECLVSHSPLNTGWILWQPLHVHHRVLQAEVATVLSCQDKKESRARPVKATKYMWTPFTPSHWLIDNRGLFVGYSLYLASHKSAMPLFTFTHYYKHAHI